MWSMYLQLDQVLWKQRVEHIFSLFGWNHGKILHLLLLQVTLPQQQTEDTCWPWSKSDGRMKWMKLNHWEFDKHKWLQYFKTSYSLTALALQTQVWHEPDWPALGADLRGELRKANTPWVYLINWQKTVCSPSTKDTDNKHPSSAFASLPDKLHLGKKRASRSKET